MANFIQAAFNAVCENAVQAESWYVVLAESAPYYGGAEEGGWWGRDTIVLAFQEFTTKEAAERAAKSVEELAEKMRRESEFGYGERCLTQWDWCESRGLEADYLPEDDGPSDYMVFVTNEVPQNSYGSRQYS